MTIPSGFVTSAHSGFAPPPTPPPLFQASDGALRSDKDQKQATGHLLQLLHCLVANGRDGPVFDGRMFGTLMDYAVTLSW